MAYLTRDEALTRLRSCTPPLSEVEAVALSQSLGRTLAKTIAARYAVPPFDRAAMDGYAVRAAETPGRFRLAGTVAAGDTWTGAGLQPGQAVRILTGAPLPVGADCVVEQEQVAREHDAIVIARQARPGRNIAGAGTEWAAGQPVLRPGQYLGPLELGVAASAGRDVLTVFRKPRVLLIVTGSEIVPPGQPLGPGQIYNVNRFLLEGWLAKCGAEVTVAPPVPDTPAHIRQALDQDLDRFDLVITTGGVSVGDRDFVIEHLKGAGDLLFWRVDMHPGKSIAASRHGGTTILALSGNPGAALTSWFLLGAPLIAHLNHGVLPISEVPGYLLEPFPKPTRETRYVRTRFVYTADGVGFDTSLTQSSDTIRAYSDTDGFMIIPQGSPALPAGARLTALRIAGLGPQRLTWEPAPDAGEV